MRQIEQNMVNAVNGRYNFKSGNTQVTVNDDIIRVYLHGNCIYTECNSTGKKRCTLAGWNTPTTRSRLRALGVNIKQKKGLPVVNGYSWLSDYWYNI